MNFPISQWHQKEMQLILEILIDTTAGTGGSGTSNQTRGVYRPASGYTGTQHLKTTVIATTWKLNRFW